MQAKPIGHGLIATIACGKLDLKLARMQANVLPHLIGKRPGIGLMVEHKESVIGPGLGDAPGALPAMAVLHMRAGGIARHCDAPAPEYALANTQPIGKGCQRKAPHAFHVTTAQRRLSRRPQQVKHLSIRAMPTEGRNAAAEGWA